jgi:hypothetical protein
MQTHCAERTKGSFERGMFSGQAGQIFASEPL